VAAPRDAVRLREQGLTFAEIGARLSVSRQRAEQLYRQAGEPPQRKAASSRRKGVRAEAEVRRIFEAAGFEVRGLEGLGDHVVVCGNGLTLHSEVKRQERLKLPEWLRQAQAEAPQGAVPVVAFRQSRQEWYAALPLAALVQLAAAASLTLGQYDA
jgi:hypothetical protein